MRLATWLNLLILASGVFPCQTFSQTASSSEFENPCSIHLTRLTGKPDKTITINGKRFHLFYEDVEVITELRSSLRSSKLSNVVIYVPVQQSQEMLTLRYESTGPNTFAEQVVKKVQMDFFELQRRLLEMNVSDGQAESEALGKMLLPDDRGIDKGKTVLFRNIAYYGLVPESLGFDGDTAILTSSNLGRALRNYGALNRARIDPSGMTVFTGYPDSQEEYDAVFKEGKNGELQNWQVRTAEVKSMQQEFGFELVANKDYQKLSQQEVLSNMGFGAFLRMFREISGSRTN